MFKKARNPVGHIWLRIKFAPSEVFPSVAEFSNRTNRFSGEFAFPTSYLGRGYYFSSTVVPLWLICVATLSEVKYAPNYTHVRFSFEVLSRISGVSSAIVRRRLGT